MTEDMKKTIQEECAFEDLIWYNLQEINAISTKNLNKVKNNNVDTIVNTIVYQSPYIELDGDYNIFYNQLHVGYLNRINIDKYISSLKNNEIDMTKLRLYLN
jgi:hypothetical protein